MTPEQRELVLRTWPQLRADGADAAAVLYRNLFTIAPGARRLFTSKNMHAQGAHFMDMLAVYIRSLSGERGTLEAIRACGRRHIGYGVVYTDYDELGSALLATLEEVLGPERCTADVRDAWAAAYLDLATTMRQASSAIV